jgi:DNA-binding CsgD family transcriptional regulator
MLGKAELLLRAAIVPPSANARPLLSRQELRVLRYLAQGYSNERIARELVVAVGTVKRHTRNIYHKLNVHSRLDDTETILELFRLSSFSLVLCHRGMKSSRTGTRTGTSPALQLLPLGRCVGYNRGVMFSIPNGLLGSDLAPTASGQSKPTTKTRKGQVQALAQIVYCNPEWLKYVW